MGTVWMVLAGRLTLLLVVAVFDSCRRGDTSHITTREAPASVSVVQERPG